MLCEGGSEIGERREGKRRGVRAGERKREESVKGRRGGNIAR